MIDKGNSEGDILIAIRDFLIYYRWSRVPVLVVLSAISIVISYFSISYLWLDLIPYLIDWGKDSTEWWKPFLSWLGILYLALGGAVGLFSLIAFPMFVISIYIEEKKEKLGIVVQKVFDKETVFVVHGHDNEMKESVARFLSQIESHPIILHEKNKIGKTVIEKFEHNASLAGYAVILFTPDDIGYSASDINKKNRRARQNVILELGYFMGMLGRNRVCVLIKGDVEIPSDIMGIVYIQFDESGAWKLRLINEMKAVNMAVNQNKIFE